MTITVLLVGPTANADYDDARAAAAEGRYRQSITLFQEAVAAAANDTGLRRALWGLADVYRQQGRNNAALESLIRAQPLVATDEATAAQQLRLGGIYYGLGRYVEAETALGRARQLESRLTLGERSALFLDLGNVQVETGTFERAAAYYTAAAQAAIRANRIDLETRAWLNVLRAKLDAKELSGFETLIGQIEEMIQRTSSAHVRRSLYLALGDVY